MKKFVCVLLIAVLLFSFAGCNKSMNSIIKNEPSFTAVVEEVYENSVLVSSEDMAGYPTPVQATVSLRDVHPDSMTDLQVGDIITVYYDGCAAETDPLQINTVYAVLLTEPFDRTQNEKP